MKKAFKISVITLAVLFSLALAKNPVAQAIIENGVRFMTGLKLDMRSLAIGLANTSIGIKDLKLFNPRGYPDKIMLDMPEIFINYKLAPLFQGKVELEEVRIYLKEFIIEKNQAGEVNLNALKPVQAQKSEPKQKKSKAPKETPKKSPIQIDRLNLKIEKVVYKDYSKKGGPSIREFALNLDESYANITNPYGVVSIILVKVLTHTSLAAVTNIDLGPLSDSVSDALASSKRLAAETALKARAVAEEKLGEATAEVRARTQKLAEIAPEELKDVTGALGERTKEITKGFSETAGNLKDKIKLPFGGERS